MDVMSQIRCRIVDIETGHHKQSMRFAINFVLTALQQRTIYVPDAKELTRIYCMALGVRFLERENE